MEDRWRLIGYLMFVFGTVVLTNCGSSATEISLDASVASDPTPKIVGIAEGQGDVGSNEVGPLAGYKIALIPAADASDLWAAIDLEPDDFQLANIGGIVAAAAIPTADVVQIGNGEFTADPMDGDYLVCLLRGEDPWGLAGCGRMQVAGPASWVVGFGEGGVYTFERE